MVSTHGLSILHQLNIIYLKLKDIHSKFLDKLDNATLQIFEKYQISKLSLNLMKKSSKDEELFEQFLSKVNVNSSVIENCRKELVELHLLPILKKNVE